MTMSAVQTDSDLLDSLDRKIIVATQAGLPLVTEPYQAVAEQCGTTAEEVKSRLQRMLNSGVIRRIGAVPNHYTLGFRGNGMTVWDVPDEKVRELGQKIGALDFVSHAYHRPRHLPECAVFLYPSDHPCRNPVRREPRPHPDGLHDRAARPLARGGVFHQPVHVPHAGVLPHERPAAGAAGFLLRQPDGRDHRRVQERGVL